MGSHIGFYKVLDNPSFVVEELKERYLKLLKENGTEDNPPWDKFIPEYPFYYVYEDTKEPLTNERMRTYESWFRDTLDNEFHSGIIFPLEGNPLLDQFKDKAFQIPCQQCKGENEELIETFPLFLEFEEINCPWVRIFPEGATFIAKESFLQYLKSKLEANLVSSMDYEECVDFFGKNFINREHLIQLG